MATAWMQRCRATASSWAAARRRWATVRLALRALRALLLAGVCHRTPPPGNVHMHTEGCQVLCAFNVQVPLSDVVPDNQIRNATRTLEDLDR